MVQNHHQTPGECCEGVNCGCVRLTCGCQITAEQYIVTVLQMILCYMYGMLSH